MRVSRPYVNAVALLDTTLSPESLLRVLKRIERRLGQARRQAMGSSARSISTSSTIRGWSGIGATGEGTSPAPVARPLVLPHPLAHERPFVLKPLLDIVPDWRHPVLKQCRRALAACDQAGQGAVIKRL